MLPLAAGVAAAGGSSPPGAILGRAACPEHA
jgi:hypothetical protein